MFTTWTGAGSAFSSSTQLLSLGRSPGATWEAGASAAPQVPAEPAPLFCQVSSWLVFMMVGWALLSSICFLPFQPQGTPVVYFSYSSSHLHLLLPSPRTCFAFSNLWKRCTAAPPRHHGHVLVVPLIPLPHLVIQSACPLLQGKWLGAGLITSSSSAPLGGLRVTVTHPAFLTGGRLAELGVPAGEGGPWLWLGQLPSPAPEEALLGKTQQCSLSL